MKETNRLVQFFHINFTWERGRLACIFTAGGTPALPDSAKWASYLGPILKDRKFYKVNEITCPLTHLLYFICGPKLISVLEQDNLQKAHHPKGLTTSNARADGIIVSGTMQSPKYPGSIPLKGRSKPFNFVIRQKRYSFFI